MPPLTPTARATPPRRCVCCVAAGTLAVGLLSACGSSATASSGVAAAGSAAAGRGVVDVVAGENPWGDVARQIGGHHVEVTSIISDPDADPHTYETDPAAAAAIATARVVVLNGAGYDEFASKLLRASPGEHRTVLSVDQVVDLRGNDPNPHLWYDPQYVHEAADAIAAALAAADPGDAPAFAANEKSFLSAYQPYVDELATIEHEHAGEEIAYTERVAGYLVTTAGLKLGTPASFSASLEDGDDPSAADTLAFDHAITRGSVKALLYDAQVTDAETDQVKALAKGAGVPIVAVTETLPTGEDFQTWQLDQARALLAALGG